MVEVGAGRVGGLEHVLAVMDFDGTITSSDCMQTVLRRHVAAWSTLAEAVSRPADSASTLSAPGTVISFRALKKLV